MTTSCWSWCPSWRSWWRWWDDFLFCCCLAVFVVSCRSTTCCEWHLNCSLHVLLWFLSRMRMCGHTSGRGSDFTTFCPLIEHVEVSQMGQQKTQTIIRVKSPSLDYKLQHCHYGLKNFSLLFFLLFYVVVFKYLIVFSGWGEKTKKNDFHF